MAQSWEEAKQEILNRIDIRSYLEGRGVKKWTGKAKKGNVNGCCPMHDDKQASLSVNLDQGTFKCFAPDCPAAHGGSIFDWVMIQDGIDFRSAFEVLAKETQVAVPDSKPPLDPVIVERFHGALLRDRQRMAWLLESRGLHRDTIGRYKLGWDGTRFTIPVFDEHGQLRNVRRYMPNPKGKAAKFLNFTQDGVKYGEVRLFGVQQLAALEAGAEVVLCEGEMDCLLLQQEGFNAATSTGGAGAFKGDWIKWFMNRQVLICFDNDQAGRTSAERIATMFFEANIDVRIARLPESVGPKGDVTDFFVALGGTAKDFKGSVLAPAIEFEPTEFEESETIDPISVTLPKSSEAQFLGKPLKVKVMVSGKDTTPYVVPKKVKIRCPVDGRKACAWCGLALKNGSLDHEFSSKDRELIAFTAASDKQVLGYIHHKFGIASRCDAKNIDVEEEMNVEELRLIPEIDYFHQADTLEEEYVVRQAYFTNQGLQANRSYEIDAYAHSDPRSQYAMLVVGKATPAQDSISSFTMTDETAEALSIFKAGDTIEAVEARFADIATDLEANVHQIFQRHEMQTALDLCWHSVIGFDFADKQIRKGWIECLVMGDSGQGKTEMSLCLLQHYGMGERVQGEQVSMAGLVGGVEQAAKRWMLTWGKMPLNDRRLLIIEETGGMQQEDLQKLSDVRSTGVAEITKMRTERTNARCRLIFLSNPRTGRPVRTYDQGVQTVLELFGKAEDVRRLDFAIIVATNEVPLDVLNRVEKPQVEHVYTRDLCKKLILWAWSRRPSQVVFTEDAHRAIVAASREMATMYSSKIPLVEPADQKIKLARLSAAAAARVFSTAEDPNVLLVDKQHVGFIVKYLHAQYGKPTMAYREYSEIADQGERLDRIDRAAFMERFRQIPRWRDVVLVLTRSRVLRKNQMIDMIGWDRDESRVWFRVLTTELAALRSTTNGFVKEPFFIPLLRELADEVRGGPGNNGADPEEARDEEEVPAEADPF